MSGNVKAVDMTPAQECHWEMLFSKARRALDSNDGAGALEAARAAWAAVPEPRLASSVAYISLMRLMRAFQLAKSYAEGIALLDWVIAETPFERQIPVFLVQKGILHFESGELVTAKEVFARSWAIAGDFGFRGEDPKYLAFCAPS